MNLVTDRTQADVDRAASFQARGFANLSEAEQAEWLAGLKGAYNYSDLNRVEAAVKALADMMNISLVVKTDWAVTDIPLAADMQRYLDNIRALRARNTGLATTPNTPDSMAGLTYKAANEIEQILMDIETNINANNTRRCGTMFCGEV